MPPDLALDAIEGARGDHVDLAHVGIGAFSLVIGDDAVDEGVLGLVHGTAGDLEHVHVAVAIGARHAVAVAPLGVGADGRTIDVRGAHLLVLADRCCYHPVVAFLGSHRSTIPSIRCFQHLYGGKVISANL